MALTLMKGSEAIAEAAIRAGARFFFGYPITPQTEIPEYMSARMPEVGGCFLQAESEVAAINMVYGAAGTGARVITSSSSPGVSLKQEGISYCAGGLPSGRRMHASLSSTPPRGSMRIVHATLNSECATAMPSMDAASPKNAGLSIDLIMQNTISHTAVPRTLKQR